MHAVTVLTELSESDSPANCSNQTTTPVGHRKGLSTSKQRLSLDAPFVVNTNTLRQIIPGEINGLHAQGKELAWQGIPMTTMGLTDVNMKLLALKNMHTTRTAHLHYCVHYV